MQYEVQDFQVDVIEASREKPVLVDFWAPWCGPCRALSPTLERLAQEQSDKWTLVKVNTDQHPEVSMSYGIRGIPAVKLFVDGKVVDEFTGALPEYAVRQWLDKAVPTESKARIETAEREIAAGNRDRARELLESALESEPEDPKARILLAQVIALDEPERAEELVSGSAFAGPSYLQVAEAVKTVARLFNLNGALPEGEARDTYLGAIEAMKSRQYDEALKRFIEVIRTDRYYDDDGSRKACIALFTLLGNDHPAVRAYRRQFDMALY